MPVTCFWLDPVNQARVGLRRYQSSSLGSCPLPDGYHQAIACVADVPVTWADAVPPGTRHSLAGASRGDPQKHGLPEFTWPARDDPAWPAQCGCGYEFTAEDPYQEWFEQLWQRADTGELVTLRDAPDGAMWDAFWLPGPFCGPDGRALMVRCPGGHDWTIDGRASNCTLPDDTGHRCWIRHGDPPCITVDKNGRTCAAGAGSIQAGSYHGFLRDGAFT